ncbi:iron-containing alcohol dehydrogenase [Acidobacteriota bacterium]
MFALKAKAQQLIFEFKGDDYIFGLQCLDKVGKITALTGDNILLITNLHQRGKKVFDRIVSSLESTDIKIVGHTLSARPNSPTEDVFRLAEAISVSNPNSILVASGGSGIDASKAAIVLADLGGVLEDYFGAGKVTEKILESKKSLTPCLALQTASGSSAHLTKYSNITDFSVSQKKLIIDTAIVPPKSLFDYSLTQTMSPSFTCDGAFDGLAHCLEVYYGARGDSFDKIEEVVLTGIELILASLETAVIDPENLEAREALGLATDLGGYAIMMGGTNGAHLTSFSLVDILSHGRACALLNPYYTVFFAPAIQHQLQRLTELFSKYGLMPAESTALGGKELGIAVANGLAALSKKVDFPTTLSEIEGMDVLHIEKALTAAKNPQLESKLKNMPVPLKASHVDIYMRPILQAALNGDFHLIKMFQ